MLHVILFITTHDSLLLCLAFVKVYSLLACIEVRFLLCFILEKLTVLVI